MNTAKGSVHRSWAAYLVVAAVLTILAEGGVRLTSLALSQAGMRPDPRVEAMIYAAIFGAFVLYALALLTIAAVRSARRARERVARRRIEVPWPVERQSRE
jgi:amino acid transporter